MIFNRWIRQFLRREESECHVDSVDFPEMLILSGYHAFASMIDDPDVELVDLFDAEGPNPFSSPEKTGVTWFPRRTGYERKRIFPLSAYALIRHHGIDDLEMALHIEPCGIGVRISVCFGQENVDHRPAVKAWMEQCEQRSNPFTGRLLAFGGSLVEFLPPQNVETSDVLLPEEVLDTLKRSFTFLRNPEDWPSGLRHRAVLLAGAPGLGKSLAARWLAEELGVTTVWITAGVLCDVAPASIFDWARRLKPVLLVLDDLAVALGPDGDDGRVGDFLGEMDGFTDLDGIGILATTNDLNGLDQALDPRTRPGRFHRLIELQPPNRTLREALIARRCLVSGGTVRPSEPTVTFLSEATAGFTGAQIAELVDEAYSRAVWDKEEGRSPDVDRIFETTLAERSRPVSVGFTTGARSA